MTRNLALLALLVAAVAALWLVTLEDDAPRTVPGAERESDPDFVVGPTLVGSADTRRETTDPTTGRFQVRGRVLDGGNEPLAGVAVEVHRDDTPFGVRKYDEAARRDVERVARSVQALRTPTEERPPDHVLTSDADGRFVYGTDAAGQVTFRARVEPPRVGTQRAVALFENGLPTESVLHVLDGVLLEGRVVDAAGGAVAATVKAVWRDERHGRFTGHAVADVDSGDFTFPAVPRGSITFTVATAHGTYHNWARVEAPHEGRVVLRLPARSTALEARVHQTDGTPILGAYLRVRVRPDGVDPRQKLRSALRVGAETDADGHVRLEALPAGKVVAVSGAARGYRIAQLREGDTWEGIDLEEGGTATLDLVLTRGSVVRGRVLDAADGTPLPGADVTIRFLGWHPPQVAMTTADADGRYLLEGIGEGRFLLIASHDTHYCPQLAAALDRRAVARTTRESPAELTLQIGAEETVYERDLTLLRGGRVRGRVVDPEDRPVAGAEVFVKDGSVRAAAHVWGVGGLYSVEEQPAATSAADGSFQIDALAPDLEWVLFARKPGLAGAYADPVTVEAGTCTENVIVRLAPGCTLRGVVLDEAGKPFSGQHVFVGGMQTELAGGSQRAVTDADGRFETDSLPAGSHTLSALRSDGQRRELEVEGLQPGEVREGLVLSFATGGEVAGIVVDGRGAPVASLRIGLRPLEGVQVQRQAVTDAEGRFRFEGVEGRHEIAVVSGRTSVPLGRVDQVPATDLHFVHDRTETVRLEVRILDPDGAPVPWCRLTVRSADGKPSQPGRDGRVEGGASPIEAEGRPPYAVQVSQPCNAQGRPLNLRGAATVVVSDSSEPVVIRLARGNEIGGRCVDEQERPVPDVLLHARHAQSRSDAEGRWHLVGLGDGLLEVRVDPPGDFIAPVPLQAEPGRLDLVVRLTKGQSIAGRVIVAEGVTLQAGSVTGRWASTADRRAGSVRGRLSPTGTFRLRGIPPDVLVTVRVEPYFTLGSANPPSPSEVADVEPGTEDLEIRLDAGVTLSGRVVDARGEPVVTGHVNLLGPNRQGGWDELDGRGCFEVKGVTPGTYHVLYVNERNELVPIGRDVEAPASNLLLTLPDNDVLAGRLLGTTSDEGWRVRVIDAETGQPPVGSRRFDVAPDGTWEIPGVFASGRWVVIANRGEGDRYARSEPVEAGTTGIVLEPKPGERITGRVEQGGRPVPGSWVIAQGPGWQSFGRVDPEGAFVLRGLPPGTYVLTARASGREGGAKLEGVTTGSTDVVLDLLDPE